MNDQIFAITMSRLRAANMLEGKACTWKDVVEAAKSVRRITKIIFQPHVLFTNPRHVYCPQIRIASKFWDGTDYHLVDDPLEANLYSIEIGDDDCMFDVIDDFDNFDACKLAAQNLCRWHTWAGIPKLATLTIRGVPDFEERYAGGKKL